MHRYLSLGRYCIFRPGYPASTYPKLRLSCAQVATLLTDAGFSLEYSAT